MFLGPMHLLCWPGERHTIWQIVSEEPASPCAQWTRWLRLSWTRKPCAQGRRLPARRPHPFGRRCSRNAAEGPGLAFGPARQVIAPAGNPFWIGRGRLPKSSSRIPSSTARSDDNWSAAMQEIPFRGGGSGGWAPSGPVLPWQRSTPKAGTLEEALHRRSAMPLSAISIPRRGPPPDAVFIT